MSNFNDTNLIVFTDKLLQRGTNIAIENQGNARTILPILLQAFAQEYICFGRHSPKQPIIQPIRQTRGQGVKAPIHTKTRW